MREIRLDEQTVDEKLNTLNPDEKLNFLEENLLDVLALDYSIGIGDFNENQLERLRQICDSAGSSGDELLGYVIDTGVPSLRRGDGSTIKVEVRKKLDGLKSTINNRISRS